MKYSGDMNNRLVRYSDCSVGVGGGGGLACLSGSIYPETLGYEATHWLDEPTGRGIPPVSLVTEITTFTCRPRQDSALLLAKIQTCHLSLTKWVHYHWSLLTQICHMSILVSSPKYDHIPSLNMPMKNKHI